MLPTAPAHLAALGILQRLKRPSDCQNSVMQDSGYTRRIIARRRKRLPVTSSTLCICSSKSVRGQGRVVSTTFGILLELPTIFGDY